MHGANTEAVQELVDKGRARLVRAVMEVLEARAFPSMADGDVKRVRRVVRAEINVFHESMSDLVGQVVDETVEMNANGLAMVADMALKNRPS